MELQVEKSRQTGLTDQCTNNKATKIKIRDLINKSIREILKNVDKSALLYQRFGRMNFHMDGHPSRDFA